MTKAFSISRKGIQIPYRTFLADSASGLVLILFLLACYLFPIVTPAPLRSMIAGTLADGGLGTELTVFVLFALFLLATPLGFALNALSWLLLDQTIDTLEHFCNGRAADCIYPVRAIKRARHVEIVADHFQAHERGFTATGWFLMELLEAPQLAAFAPDTNARGIMIFLRNMTVLLLVVAGISIFMAHRSVMAGVAVAGSAILACLALMLRWRGGGRWRQACAGVAALVAASAFVSLVANRWESRFAIQAAVLVSIAGILVLAQGLIGYYHHTLIMLNAYFAACSTDVALRLSPTPNSAVKAIASEILHKAMSAAKRDDRD